MTHRERHTSDDAPARGATRPASAAPTREPSGSSLWADWYERASPAQQQAALLRAVQQGVLYAHQLDAPAQSASPRRSLLSHLLNGQAKELEPLYPPVLDFHDDQLDRMQREAVARAVATPDVCLIQGLSGTGKSRLLAEILVQAAQRGERILFLASTAAALDTVLERLGTHASLCPIRCLAADEPLASLPPAVARLTLPERLRSYRQMTLPAARTARDAARRALEVRLREQRHWPQLQELAEQYDRLAERLRTLSERRDAIAAEVERLEQTCAAFRERWQACERAQAEALERLDSQLAGLEAELETTTGKQAHLDSDWEAIRPLAEARQGRRFWTGSWWRAVLRSDLREQVCDLEDRRAELHAAQRRLQQELATRQNERTDVETRYAAECRRLQDEEIARRRAELDVEMAAVTRQQDSLRQQWQTSVQGISAEAAPAEISRQAVQARLAVWERLCEQDAQRAASAEQWLQTIEKGVRLLPEKLAGCANVIAATTAMLANDEHFGDRNGTPTVLFDLLILEEAHQIPELEFAAAARRARRWVLIGEAQTDPDTARGEGRVASSPQGRRSTRHSPRATRHFFQRLWHNLHADPYHLPFTWMTCDGRLLCRLRPFSDDQLKWIETEPVVDRPDIELRILSVPRQPPRVVEILFPACMDLGEAKQFLFHELEELAVQTHGRSPCWSETAEDVILELAPGYDAESTIVSLESGVRERVARWPASTGTTAADGMDWHTCALEFARAAGWTRQRAEAWIAERLGLRTTGRTVLLTASFCPTCQKSQTAKHTKDTKKTSKTP